MPSLYNAFRDFEKRFKNVNYIHDVKDGVGAYAIEFSNSETGKPAFFCHKNSRAGKTVSVHNSLYEEAKKRCMPIILSLEGKYFYMFTSYDIEKECYANEKEDGTRMMNFPITSGRSLQKKDKQPPKELPDDGLSKLPKGKALQEELGPLEREG